MQLKEFKMPLFMKIEENATSDLNIVLKNECSNNKSIILGIDSYINTIYGELIYKQLINLLVS